MVPLINVCGLFMGCAASFLLGTQATAPAKATPKPPGVGFDWRPAILAEAEANRRLNVWNVQPVVPFRLNNDFFLISRTIVPVIQRPLAGESDIIGIGDINPTVFLVPRTTSRLQFGFGPTLVIPSATDVQLSTQRWSAGPAGVAVYTRGALVAGILANNI
jgi:hypothetical protein